MVKSVTSFGRSGLSDWLLQRVSGVILLAYAICLGGTLVIGVNYAQWQAMFASTGMRVFTLLAILSLAAHAWIGMWCVLTDYITVRLIGPKATAIRIFFQLAMIAITLLYVVWAIDILWGI